MWRLQLTDKANIGVDDGAALPHKLEGVLVGHVVVLHEVGDAESGRARLTGPTVDQDLAAAEVDLLDLVCHKVKVDVEFGADPVLHCYLNGLLHVGG